MNPFRIYRPEECGPDDYPFVWHRNVGGEADDLIGELEAAGVEIGRENPGIKHIVRAQAGQLGTVVPLLAAPDLAGLPRRIERTAARQHRNAANENTHGRAPHDASPAASETIACSAIPACT